MRTVQEKARNTDVYVAIETLRMMVLDSRKLNDDDKEKMRGCLHKLEVEMLTR